MPAVVRCRAAGRRCVGHLPWREPLGAGLRRKPPEIRRVVLSFRGAFDVSGTGFRLPDDAGAPITFRAAGTTLPAIESIRAALARTVGFLLDHGKTVWLLLQVPELGFKVEECAGRPVSVEHHIRTPCAVAAADVAARQAPYRRIVDEVRQQQPALEVFDPMPSLCDERWCHAIVDQTLLYADDNHLSRAGSLFVAKRFTF